jgi:thiol-disulfide isomerase/thioredoxin
MQSMSITRNLCALSAFLAAAAFATAPVLAQDLTAGSKAPALSIEEWMKGKAVSSFEPGQTYVVEFWATWCPPCLKSIPHLTEVQKKYADSKVTVIGVASSERPKTAEAQRAGMVKFIEGKGDEMAYTIAFDPDHSMSETWMRPANQNGIPTCFIVDGTGTIAWIGSPFVLDEPLEKIVAGKWDIKAEAANAKAKAELQAKLQPLMQKANAATQQEQWDEALTALDEAIALGAEAEKQVTGWKFYILLQKKDYEQAYAFAEKAGKGVFKDDANGLNQLAWLMVDPETADSIEKKNLDLALRMSTRSCELSKGKPDEPMMLDTLATVHSAKGENAKAVEIQTRAVALMQGKDGVEEFEAKLEAFKLKAAQG